MKWFIKCFRHFLDFKGRARRREFWFFLLFEVILLCVAFILDFAFFLDFSELLEYDGLTAADLEAWLNSHSILGSNWFDFLIFTGIVELVCFIPGLSVAVRRLHDIGKSGWWMALLYVLTILMVVLNGGFLGALLVLLNFGVSIWFLVWFFMDSQYETNRWGACPKLEPNGCDTIGEESVA